MSVIAGRAKDQLLPSRCRSKRLATVATWSPVRKAINTTSTPRGINAGTAGDKAIAAAASKPVLMPTA